MTTTDAAAQAGAPIEFAEVGGVRVAVRTSGPLDAPTVLLLHGIGRTLDDWLPLQAALSADHRVCSIDLPGFGETSPLRGRHTLRTLAEFTHRFIDESGLGAVHVVGNSLGGAVAMQLAATNPEQVRSLLLLASAGFGRSVTVALRIMAIPVLNRRLLRPSEHSARRVERSLFFDGSHVDPERIARKLSITRPHHARVFLQVSRSLGGIGGVKRRWRRRLLAQVAASGVPVGVVWGREDRVLPAAHAASVHAAIPHADVHTLARTGHLPQIERTADVADIARTFWQRTAAATTAGPSTAARARASHLGPRRHDDETA